MDFELLDAQHFWHILWMMPERMRRTVTLRKVYGWTWVHIAQRLHMSPLEVERELAASEIIFAAHANEVLPHALH